MRCAAVGCGHLRIGRQQVSWRAGPEPVENLGLAALVEKVAIAIASEGTRSTAEAEGSLLGTARGLRDLQRADVRLVVAKTLVFGGVFRAEFDRHSGGHADVNHGLVYALGMHIDFDSAAGFGEGFKERLPEIPAPFRNSAFTVDAHGNALNFRALL